MATRIPINKESNLRFDDHQKRIWEEMETGMERRRREWEEEIEKMRKEFFTLRPEEEGLGSGLGSIKGSGAGIPLGIGERLGPRSRLLETSSSSADECRGMVVKDEKGNPVFKVLFDVHDYRPEEVSVRMDANKVMVSARHEAQQGGSSVSREYSRQVNIPPNIDPLALQCSMGPDGILAVEAPIPAPSYSTLKDSATSLPIRSGSPASSASSSSSSSTTPVHQSSTSTSSYQTSYQRGADPGYPAGYKPVSSQLQNSAPPPGRGSQTPASSLRDTSSSSSSSVYSKVSPAPFQASSSSSQQAAPSYSPPLKAGSGGRIGSPVLMAEPGKFRVEIDIEDFKPEELTVKTQDKRVMVCAKREEKVGHSSSTRELSRERSLPDSVDPLTIKAFFTDGGKLIIEAPYREGAAQSQISSR